MTLYVSLQANEGDWRLNCGELGLPRALEIRIAIRAIVRGCSPRGWSPSTVDIM